LSPSSMKLSAPLLGNLGQSINHENITFNKFFDRNLERMKNVQISTQLRCIEITNTVTLTSRR
jgi:hypothetical protein